MAQSAVKKINVEALMAEIREDVKAELQDQGGSVRAFRSKAAHSSDGSRAALVLAEELNYLNANWHKLAERAPITSHRKFLGSLIVRAKKFFVDITWNYLLRDYFEKERQFQMNLVRHLNTSARYIDARVSDSFWQLVHKIDEDVRGTNERADRLYDEASASMRTLEVENAKRMGKLEADRDSLVQLAKTTDADIAQINDLIQGLERTLSVISKQIKGRTKDLPTVASATADAKSTSTDGETSMYNTGVDYLLLENRYRGSEESITERLRDYVENFKQAPATVLEMGCGRGEFLELLKAAGITAFGVDLDEAMILRCRQKNLDVAYGDGLTYMDQLQDKSIGGLFAAQLIEHLNYEQLDRLLGLAAKKIMPKGKILLETINPQSVTALARNFFRDPTHVWPLHPDTMRFMMESKGIKVEHVLMRSPYPEQATLLPLEISPHLPARWQATLQGINDNVTRLNDLLYGYQDYCIVGVIEKE